MNVKILKSFLILSVIILFSGCAKETIYVDRPVEIKVPVKCVVPEVVCNTNQKTYTEVINEMYRCILEQREAAKVCQ